MLGNAHELGNGIRCRQIGAKGASTPKKGVPESPKRKNTYVHAPTRGGWPKRESHPAGTHHQSQKKWRGVGYDSERGKTPDSMIGKHEAMWIQGRRKTTLQKNKGVYATI